MPDAQAKSLLPALPQVEEVLQHPELAAYKQSLPHNLLTDAVRDAVDELRSHILAGTFTSTLQPDTDKAGRKEYLLTQVVHATHTHLKRLQTPSLRRVINASGVIIHTNLGRSVMAKEAIDAVMDVIKGYSTLEYDVKTMARGSRHNHCEALICSLTGAEAAMAVNNNAAAVMMVLSEFARGGEAIVSRGELVEIGGSFRIPDIMAQSQADMVEVGATNKTHPYDYERAITERTQMLLKVHPSNYRMTGFTENVSIDELRQIADYANQTRKSAYLRDIENPVQTNTAAQSLPEILVYEDQGSGAFSRMDVFGEYAEPTVAESLKAGADIVSFSGDKLLGGPQAGIIAGKKELIDRLKKNPLARAMRLDKMTLAALEATLRLYTDPDYALEHIPTLRMLTEDAQTVRSRAEELFALISTECAQFDLHLEIVPEISRAGGGALPMCDIPTFAVKLWCDEISALDLERHLTQQSPVPIVARMHHDSVLFDARTILDTEEMHAIATSLKVFFEAR